jgi:hypothetical protein
LNSQFAVESILDTGTTRLKLVTELLDRQARLPDDPSKRSTVQLSVVRDNELSERTVSAKDDVAALPTNDAESK